MKTVDKPRFAFFGPSEMLLMGAQMNELVNAGIEFELLDDRGGSNSWIIKVKKGSPRVLPKATGVVFELNENLAIKY